MLARGTIEIWGTNRSNHQTRSKPDYGYQYRPNNIKRISYSQSASNNINGNNNIMNIIITIDII